jgi:cytochrome c peroxidase
MRVSTPGQGGLVLLRWAGIILITLCTLVSHAANDVSYSDTEMAFIRSHGPWPPPFDGDASNRLSGNPEALLLGARLFSDRRLSRGNAISCATCHIPILAFADGKSTGEGFGKVDRNTPTVLNVAFHRWYGWDGGSDSLWMQNIRPVVSILEMDGVSATRLAVEADPGYSRFYVDLYGQAPEQATNDELLVFAAKTIAAYLETLVTAPTSFDHFRQALLDGNEEVMAQYPLSAQRGLKIFSGRGRCSVCHFGPGFSNGEFAETGIPYFTSSGVDKGRFGGIKKVMTSPYNRLGVFNDSPDRSGKDRTRFLRQRHDSFGQFRIPGLRSVSRTAPYMHNGSLQTLEDVIEHYSHIDMDRLHTDGELILKPLNLSNQDARDLVRFLETLGRQ